MTQIWCLGSSQGFETQGLAPGVKGGMEFQERDLTPGAGRLLRLY